MSLNAQDLVLLIVIAICVQISHTHVTLENGEKSKVYLSPKITQHPGSASNKYFYDIEFPKGHVAIKSFEAEVVDEAGNSVSLEETYLHHWNAERYYQRKGTHQSDFVIAGNAGVCNHGHTQYFGLGSETRKTSTYVPDPYGIEVGNPLNVPAGYEEKWMLNVHVIDTRGVVDATGCIECRCNLYNVTQDEYGQPLNPTYMGGLSCCYDETQCEVKKGHESNKKSLYLKYTIKWVDWSDSIVPVKIYILDVTDIWQSTGSHACFIEHDIKQCTTSFATNDCVNTRRANMSFPAAGDVIYGVAHQHAGGMGSTLYGEDGRVICSSKPMYGEGKEAGNEAGYVVGMSTCYPIPGSAKIAKDETLTLESNYNNVQSHSGVMGLFYILLAAPSSKLNSPVQESKMPIFWA